MREGQPRDISVIDRRLNTAQQLFNLALHNVNTGRLQNGEDPIALEYTERYRHDENTVTFKWGKEGSIERSINLSLTDEVNPRLDVYVNAWQDSTVSHAPIRTYTSREIASLSLKRPIDVFQSTFERAITTVSSVCPENLTKFARLPR